jgi:hypothetical protein
MTAAAQAGKGHAEPPGPGWQTVILRVAGVGLLIAAGAIHLDLYLTGYRTIPVIGWLLPPGAGYARHLAGPTPPDGEEGPHGSQPRTGGDQTSTARSLPAEALS